MFISNDHFFPSLSCQFMSSFSVTRDLCPRLGRCPQAGKVQLDMSYIWWRGMFWFVFENISEPYEYDWGSAFVFCCCFIQLSLPLNVWMVVPWNFETFAWWIYPQKSTVRWTLYFTLIFLILVLLWANLCPSISVRTLTFCSLKGYYNDLVP